MSEDETPEPANDEAEKGGTNWIAVGLPIGMSLGVAIGVATDNLALWIALGLTLGIGGGSLIELAAKRGKSE